jgi:hypothetical protein
MDTINTKFEDDNIQPVPEVAPQQIYTVDDYEQPQETDDAGNFQPSIWNQ